MENTGMGRLKIRVLEAGGALPVEGALVQIFNYNNDRGRVLYTLRTDKGGITPTVELPAPAAALSCRPGGAQPYGVYTVTVRMPGYYTVENIGVMIFDGILAIQPVQLLPLGEAAQAADAGYRPVQIYETPLHVLGQHGTEAGTAQADGAGEEKSDA